MRVLLWLLCTQTLRRQVQHSRDQCLRPDQASYVQELQLQHLIGKGGFGTVYSGTWQGSPVAFKVRQAGCGAAAVSKRPYQWAVMLVLFTLFHVLRGALRACYGDGAASV